jgi:hypothetical protein
MESGTFEYESEESIREFTTLESTFCISIADGGWVRFMAGF